MDVAAGTIVVWSDIACPWATLAVHRLNLTRARLDLDDRVRFDHRAFPLEVFNERPTPRKVLAAEVPVVGGLAPEFGWQVWQAPDSWWPVTTLPALEAVQAAKEQGLEASEQLDYALRRAFFAESGCISMRHVILDVAAGCPAVDVDLLRKAIDDGRCRRTVIEHREEAERHDVQGSPHLFLPDGGDVHNPGVRMHWEGEHGGGFPVVDADDPSAYEDVLRRAAG
jgi:predicted DsbA family dithiol-disulfide isomerase